MIAVRPSLVRGLARLGRRWQPQSETGIAMMLSGIALVGGAIAVRLSTRAGTAAPLVLVLLVVVPALMIAVFARPVVGVALVLASIPIGSHGVPKLPMQLVQVLILMVAGIVAVRRIGTKEGVLGWHPALWWFLGVVGWAVVGLPSAADATAGVRQTLLLVWGLMFAAAVIAACRTRETVRLALAALLVVAAGIAATTPRGVGHVKAQFGASLVTGRAQGVFNQPNELGTFSAVALLVAIGLALGGKTRRSRRVAGLLVLVIFVPFALSLSRGAWIGVTLGFIYLVFALPEARRIVLALAVPALLVGITVGSFAPSNPEVQVVSARAKSIVGQRNPYDDRPHIWAEARRQILLDPWTGQGAGAFPVVAARSGSETVTFYPDHAHNIFLTWGAELGLPAVLALLAMLAHVGFATRRATHRARADGRPRDAVLMACLAAALIAVVGQGLIDYTLRAAVLLTEVAAVLGALLALARIEAAESAAA